MTAFRPKDIHPCTVDPSSWSEDVSIQRLFGHLCSGRDFAHDAYMREILEDTDDEGNQRARKRARYDENLSTQSTQNSSLPEDGHAALTLEGKRHLDTQEQTSGLPVPGDEHQKPVDGQSTDSPSLQSFSTLKSQTESKTQNETAGMVDQIKAKREEVRKAHQYLQEHADPNLIHVRPLPPWPPEERPSQNEEDIRTPTHQPSKKLPQDNSDDEDFPSPQLLPAQQQDSQLTDTTFISIPESALLISPPPREEHTRNTSNQIDTHDAEEQHIRNRITARTRARVAAYLAAREDSWVDMSLTSAGNNHAEEEMEL